MAKLEISDVPPPKSKGLDVVKEFENSSSKRNASFVVVGKSTWLMQVSVLQYPDILKQGMLTPERALSWDVS